MSMDASVRNTGIPSQSNELIDKQIHNLKLVANEDQGYLFYNHKKGMFEKQTYSNWFVLALKVIFVSPWRYMFGFTSDKDYVFGGMKKLMAETEKTLLEKPDDEKAKELLDLIKKVKETTLPRMIGEMREKRLFAQETALVKLSEQILTTPAPAKEKKAPVSPFSLKSFTTPPSPQSSPKVSSSEPSTPLESSQELDTSSETASDSSNDDTIELNSAVFKDEEQKSVNAEQQPAEKPPQDPPSSIPTPPNGMNGPPPFPGAMKGPPPPPGGLLASKTVSKEEKITALTKVVLNNKTAYEEAMQKHAAIKESRLNNQEQRKLNEKRQTLIKKGMEKAPKQFVTLKNALKAKQEEFAKADHLAKQLQLIIERREKDLASAKSSGATVVKTKVMGNVLEVEIRLFETRLEEAKLKQSQEALVVAAKQQELNDAENKYALILHTEMVIGEEKATVGHFLGELEKADKALAAISKKQKELDVEFETATQDLKKAQSLYVSKEKELAKLTGQESKTGDIKEVKEASASKAGADPEAIKAFHAEKKKQLVKTMSKQFSLDHLITSPEEG